MRETDQGERRMSVREDVVREVQWRKRYARNRVERDDLERERERVRECEREREREFEKREWERDR